MEQTIIGTPVLAPVSPAHLRALHPLVVVELIIIGTPTHALANIMSPPPHLVLHPQRGVEPINIGIVIPARVNHTQVVLPAALPQMAAGQDIIGIPHTATVNQKDPRPVLLHPPVANQIIIGIPRLALVNLTLLPVILHQRAVDLTNIGIVILARVNHTQVVLQPVTLLRKVALTIITGIHIPARVDRLIQHVILHQTVADQTITGIITIALANRTKTQLLHPATRLQQGVGITTTGIAQAVHVNPIQILHLAQHQLVAVAQTLTGIHILVHVKTTILIINRKIMTG